MSDSPKRLIDRFVDYAISLIDEDGIYPMPMFVTPIAGDRVEISALDIGGVDALLLAVRKAREGAGEVILGLDRFTRPGQGISLPDFLSIYHFTSAAGWRCGVMPYWHAQSLVQPVAWDNPFWVQRMTGEIALATGQVTRAAAPD